MFPKTFNSKFSYIKVWFTDENYKPLQIEDITNITLDYITLRKKVSRTLPQNSSEVVTNEKEILSMIKKCLKRDINFQIERQEVIDDQLLI